MSTNKIVISSALMGFGMDGMFGIAFSYEEVVLEIYENKVCLCFFFKKHIINDLPCLCKLTEEELFQESLNDVYNYISINIVSQLQELFFYYKKQYDDDLRGVGIINELKGTIIE